MVDIELLAGDVELGNQPKQTRNIHWLGIWKVTNFCDNLISGNLLYNKCKQQTNQRRNNLELTDIYLADICEYTLPLNYNAFADEGSDRRGLSDWFLPVAIAYLRYH